MFLVESIIQGSQEALNIDSYEDAFSKGTFLKTYGQSKHMVSLVSHYKLLGVFLLLMMVHKLFIVIPKSCVILFATPI